MSKEKETKNTIKNKIMAICIMMVVVVVVVVVIPLTQITVINKKSAK
jgi:t-SNARE complex subunit (syntaxin)